MKKCAIYYEISESMYDSYNSLTISPRVVKAGEETQMYVYLSLISADASAIFQLVPQEDGSYIGSKKYDSRTWSGFEVTSNGDHLYTIPSLQKSDEGEYFSIFYESSDTCAYVSTQIQTLTVQDDPQPTPGVTPVGGSTPAPGSSATPSVTPGGESTPAPGSSATPSVTPGGGSTSAPGSSAAPGVTPGGGSTLTPGSSATPGVTPGGGSTLAPGPSVTPDGNSGGISGNQTRNSIPKVAKVSRLKGKAKLKGKKKTLELTWKKVSGASGYQIQFNTKKSFKGAKKISVKKSKSKYIISKLKAGKKYYVRIRAYQLYQTQSGKTKKAYGKWTVKRI